MRLEGERGKGKLKQNNNNVNLYFTMLCLLSHVLRHYLYTLHSLSKGVASNNSNTSVSLVSCHCTKINEELKRKKKE